MQIADRYLLQVSQLVAYRKRISKGRQDYLYTWEGISQLIS